MKYRGLSFTYVMIMMIVSHICVLKYDKLKEALLKRFQLTEEGFRTKFCSSTPEMGNSTAVCGKA